MLRDPPKRLSWPRSQRFALSERGKDAERSYRESVVASRSEGGRASFDVARADWAKQFGLEPDDGLYLAEVSSGPINLQHVVAALETCGKSRKDAIESLERLIQLGCIDTNLN